MPAVVLTRGDDRLDSVSSNALPLMAPAAALFRQRLLAEPGCTPLPMPVDLDLASRTPADLQWNNLLLRSQTFRRAHVETFIVPGRITVLHVCVFPHLDDPAPIFGFDMVAGPARVTGIFLDLSPSTASPPLPGLSDVLDPSELASFATKRTLPEWGDIFSSDMLAIRPADIDETIRAICLARRALDCLLTMPRFRADPAPAAVAAGQARYSSGQRRNEHTLRMLSGFIGPTPARRFIDEVLFPLEQS
jgi:phycocyanobilin:ferredoxin oxidoreductase